MKKILFIRHAKSIGGDYKLIDHNRPLSDRGFSDAEMMSNRLLKNNIIPEKFISSSAIRALNTAEIIKNKLNKDLNIQVEEKIYYNGRDGVKNVISNTTDNVNFIVIFGHNPTFESIYRDIANSSYGKFPTCAITLCSFDVDKWKNFSIKGSKIEYYDYPKNIK